MTKRRINGPSNPNYLFGFRLNLGGKACQIYALDANHTDFQSGHMRIDVEVWHDGACVFPRGATYCAVPRGTSIDGVDARELVLSLVAIKPGDTDDEYFSQYTPAQLAFAEAYGEEIGIVREIRFCDENGNVKRSR